jgi:hypothetical protein
MTAADTLAVAVAVVAVASVVARFVVEVRRGRQVGDLDEFTRWRLRVVGLRCAKCGGVLEDGQEVLRGPDRALTHVSCTLSVAAAVVAIASVVAIVILALLAPGGDK